MRRFIIEREIPQIGSADAASLQAAAEKSNAVLCELGPNIQWIESYVSGDRTFCVYLAENEDLIRKHAEISGFPATSIHEVFRLIDPTTATPA
ncbi:MAG: DUF4242 domain-containing protein [Rhodospirillales bacterium]|nr:DUF4242 domain-containing protein [Rhodospirillales bacterium]